MRGLVSLGHLPWVYIVLTCSSPQTRRTFKTRVTSAWETRVPDSTIELTSPALPKKSWVKISQIRTLAVERIDKKLAEVSPEELAQMVEGLNEIVG